MVNVQDKNILHNMPSLLLGITSGIAAYKVVDLIKLLREKNISVQVILTQSASQMVSINELEEASGQKVLHELFPKGFNYKEILAKRQVEHIQVADTADLMVIVPATANTIAKLAHGIADDFLTTTTLAVTAPVMIFPSMNVHMWQHPAMQANISQLKAYGYQVIDPDSGPLACGYDGKGRLPDIHAIAEEISKQLDRGISLKGKKILVTAGGTQEKIDDVRFMTNKSSGKMGAAIADECYACGAEVIFIKANTSVTPRYSMQQICFETADELEAILKREVQSADIFFHTAAVTDFVIESQKGKIKSTESIQLTLNPRKKILDQIKIWNPNITLIAFKAEHNLTDEELQQVATKRLAESNADAIVANDVGKPDRGFQVDTNEVFVILRDGSTKKIPLASKRDIARAVVGFVLL